MRAKQSAGYGGGMGLYLRQSSTQDAAPTEGLQPGTARRYATTSGASDHRSSRTRQIHRPAFSADGITNWRASRASVEERELGRQSAARNGDRLRWTLRQAKDEAECPCNSIVSRSCLDTLLFAPKCVRT